MPVTKDGGFLLDDSSCDPYGVVKMRIEEEKERQNASKKKAGKKKSGKKK